MYRRFFFRTLAAGLVCTMALGGCSGTQPDSHVTESSQTEVETPSETTPEAADATAPYAQSILALEEILQQSMEQAGTDAAAVVLMEDGEMIYQRFFGQADASGAPVTEDTLFNIGSVSKVYVTAAVYKPMSTG